MSINRMENASLIHYLEIIEREIGIEGDLQQASIARVLRPHIPLLIEKIRKLDRLEKEAERNGKESPRVEETHTTVQLHEPGHPVLLMRLIAD